MAKLHGFKEPANRAKHIAVIGAGITGITTAYYLAKAGYTVTVIDQERYPAMHASFANGGQISVSNSEVWTTWSNVRKGIKWIFKKDAPLLIRPTFEFAKLKWIVSFFKHTVANVYAKNTASTISMGIKSRNLYQEIIAGENVQFDQSTCGILHFYKENRYFQHAINTKSLYNDNGCEWDLVSPGKVRSLDPALSEIENVVGGAWTRSDWTGDIHKFCINMSTILKDKYKVSFVFDLPITADNRAELLSTYDAIVVAAGVGSVKIANLFGDVLPIYPVKGYSITITVPDNNMKFVPRISLLDDQAKIVTSTLGNRFRVAGTAELNGENYDIRHDRVKPLLSWVADNFPNIDASNYSSWACLRPMTPNMMPIVKQSSKQAQIFYNTGHGHLGWTLAPATAVNITSLIEQQLN